MADAKHIVRKLIETPEDPDSPESFGVNQFMVSPVAKIAASNGFVRDDEHRSDERWVKKLSNGKEAWLRTSSPNRDFEDAMDFQDPTGRKGGREWELLEMTPTNVCSHCNQDRPLNKKPCPVCKQNAKINSFNKAKQILRGNEVIMTYVLGAFLQRLATWPANTSKDFEESAAKLVRAKILEGLGIDDPDDAENIVKHEVAARNWEGILLRNGFKQRDIGIRGYERKFGAATMVNVSNSTKADHVLIGVYGLNTHGRWQCDGNEAILIRDMVDYINDYVPTARLQEAEVVPDPDDPNAAVSSFVQSKTPYHPDYAKLARFIEANQENVYVRGHVTRHGRYVHEHSTTFELFVECNTFPADVQDEIGALTDVVQKQIGEECVVINKKIYRSLESTWDDMNSDAYIDECLVSNDNVYNELGGVWDDDDDGEQQFTYEQLTPEAKEFARDKYREYGFDHQWWDHIYEEWTAELEDMGFSGVDINFSGFASQGDGASFTAKDFDFLKWANWFMSNKPLEKGHPYTDDLPVTESRRKNVAEGKVPVPIPVPAPDPDDPQAFMKQYLKTHFDHSAILAAYDYINEHQFASAPCPACDGMGGADEGMGDECEACEGSGEVADGSFDHVATLWNKAGEELRELFKRIAVNEKKLFGKVKPPQNKAITRLYDYLNQGPNGSYEEVGLLSHRAGSDIERAIDRLRKLDLQLGAKQIKHESVDDDEPSKDMLIHMGRAGDCEHHCHVCGAYCTLRHYMLPSGVQVPPYHICQQCDVRTAKLGDEHDLPDENGPAGLAGPDGPVDDNMIEIPRDDNAAAGLREGVDDPDTFMASLDKLPDHELIDTSSADGSSVSYSCACGQWSVGGVARDDAERATFETYAQEDFAKHTAFKQPQDARDPRDKLTARNFVTSLRRPVKEAYDFPDQGEQDKAEHWADDPEPDVDDPTSVLKQEVIKRSEPIQKLEIQGRRWYRRGAGGVYCTAHIYINDKLVHVTPESYGYGDMYLTHATNWLRDNGYFNGLLGDKDPIWFLRDKKIIPQLLYYATDVKRERDLW